VGKKYLTFDKTDSFMCFIQAPTTEHLDKFSTFVLFFSLLMQAAMPKTSGCTSSTILGIDTQIQYNHVLKSVSHVLHKILEECVHMYNNDTHINSDCGDLG
jgi:hypothetical protein